MMRSTECPACASAIAPRARLRLLVRDAIHCPVCAKRLAVRAAWSRSWTLVVTVLMFAPMILRGRYFPDLSTEILTLWMLVVWAGSASAAAMGRLELAPVQKPFPPLEVLKFSALLFLIVATLLAGVAALSWIAG